MLQLAGKKIKIQGPNLKKIEKLKDLFKTQLLFMLKWYRFILKKNVLNETLHFTLRKTQNNVVLCMDLKEYILFPTWWLCKSLSFSFLHKTLALIFSLSCLPQTPNNAPLLSHACVPRTQTKKGCFDPIKLLQKSGVKR